MVFFRDRPRVQHLVLFVVAYVVAGGLGQGLAIIPGISITFWPPAGIFIATLVVSRGTSWPWWVTAGCLAELTCNAIWFQNPVHLALVYYAANALEALTAAWLLARLVGTPFRLESLEQVAAFVLLAAGIAPTVGATVIAATDAIIGKHAFATAWPLVWLGDSTGLLVSTPIALVAVQTWHERATIPPRRTYEAVAVILLLLAAGILSTWGYLPTIYMTLPPLLWASARFQLRGAATAVGFITLMTAAFTMTGEGEFAGRPELMYDKMVMLKTFLGISAISALLVAALSQQRQQALSSLQEANAGLEARVAERTSALAALNASLESRVAEAIAERETAEAHLRQAQKMEAVGRLTGGLAHDFNNLLTIVIGNLALLRRRTVGLGDQRLVRNVENAIEGARRCAQLTHRLLAFSRQQPLQPEAVDANRLVGGMSDLLRRTLGEDIAFETALADGLSRTEADPNQLENAILNLAVNARDAMPAGGKLTIETANVQLDEAFAASTNGEVKAGQHVLVSVSDTGCGMAPEVQARVFEPFFTTKPVGKGTGLGLAQVYGFMRQSGGYAAVASEPGRGTTVKLYFPRLSPSETPRQPAPPVNGAASNPTAPSGTGEVILVVEDEQMVREFSASVLEEAGYRVLAVPDGPSALEALQDRRDDVALLFTDVVLAGSMSGREVADEALRACPAIKVLFTSGYARDAMVHSGRLDDGMSLLSKPFEATHLLARVRQVLDGSVRPLPESARPASTPPSNGAPPPA